MMEPPLKLFGRTIYGTPSASSHDDAAEGTTSTGAREDPPSPQDAHESGAESGAKSEVTLSGGAPASCFPELSSSGSNGAEEEKNSSSPGEGDGTPPPSQSSGGPMTEENEGLDGEDLGSGADGTTSQEVSGDDAGEKGQKTLRRPDKAVACPRCNSLETKFCYYNNYNVKQPRHFCKNCQRYWTAGGTLRNVPVGAGRRKNKHGNVISPRQATDMRLVRGDEPDIAAPMLVGKGVTMPVSVAVPVVQTVMGAPIAGSTKPVIRVTGGNSDGGSTIPYAMRVPSLEATYILTPSEPLKPGEAAVIGGNLPRLATPGFEDSTAGSSEVVDGSRGWRGWRPKEETTSGSGGSSSVHDVKNESRVSPEFNKDGSTSVTWGGSGEVQTSPSATGPFGFFNGAWPYGYNIGWSGGAFCAGGVTGNGNPMPAPPAGVTACTAWSGTAAGNMWTGIPWGLPEVAWGPGWGTPWSIGPWAMGAAAPGAPVAMAPAVSTTTPNSIHTPVPCASATSGTNLGKHPRTSDGAAAGEGAVWAPKSLRIADSDEAMRSSVWRILGVGSRPDITTSSTFRAFQPKMESKKVTDDDQQTQQASLQANPAAMSRSLYFQESN